MKTGEDHKTILTELTIKFLSGDISEPDKHLLDELLSSSDGNRLHFNTLKETWLTTSSWQKYIPELDTNKSWQKVQNSINISNTTTKPTMLNASFFSSWWKIAAAGLLLIGISSLVTLFFVNTKTTYASEMFCEVSTPLGSRSYTVLPDGTEVWLNAGTTIRYPSSFTTKDRNVYLKGEAYFKVKSDKKHPFIVHYSDVKIKALGTEFNVKAYPEENIIETTLIKGIVNVEGKDQTKKSFIITMVPKQKVTLLTSQSITRKSEKTIDINGQKSINQTIIPEEIIIPESIPVKPIMTDSVKTELYTSWKDPRWVFEGEEISKIAILLERRYNVTVLFNPEELKNFTFTGTFQQETLDQVLEILKITTPVRYQMIGKGIMKISTDPILTQKYNKYLDPKK